MIFKFLPYLLYIIVILININRQVQGNLNAKGYVRAQGTKFVDANCEEFVLNGWNSWEMIEAAIGRSGYSDSEHFEGKEPLAWMMDTAIAASMNTFRIFGHGNDPEIMTLQYSPGSYDETALYGLDRVLDLASQRNLKVILTFADNWKEVDSKWNYVWWSPTASWADDFFYDETAKSMFKNHMMFIVNRINSINGRTYQDDPTILAWNIMNEPRSESHDCQPECQQYIQTWIDEMSSFLKSIDPNHMITIGEEGFYGWNSGKEYVNPDSWEGQWGQWAMKSGQNFVGNHAGSAIDFAGIHIWVDDWAIQWDALSFFSQWIDEHMNDARQMNKPLVIEEFGKAVWSDDEIAYIRDPFFTLGYQKIAQSITNSDVLQGIMWWEWEGDEKGYMEQYDIKTYQTTWTNNIYPSSQMLTSLRDAKPVMANCIPGEWTSFEMLHVDQYSNEFVYYMFRRNLIATYEGENVNGYDGFEMVEGISREECVSRCEQSLYSSCDSLAFNEVTGGCYLKSGVSNPEDGFLWNNDGWATYWRQIGSYGDCSPNCYKCSQDYICIQCTDGYVLDREQDPYALPYCRYAFEDAAQ